MEALYYREWRDQHLEEEFPFIGSEQYFPNELFSDLGIAVYNSSSLYLISLEIGSTISGVLEDENGNTYTFSHSLFNISGSVADILDSGGKTKGKIVFGRNALNSINETFYGETTFEPSQIKVVPSCIFTFHSKQVSGITIGSKTYRGNISLIEGDGINISGTNNNIIINAVGKKPLNDCCEESEIVLKTINSNPPINGSFFIKPRVIEQPTSSSSPRQLVRINPIQNGLQITLAT